ncbi:MAG: helix-turn-helix domain-containing protein [Chloroflexi bacterium]|nr:helix-turn-helix domain-containing protein [Chloroflexota bacterium]MBP8057221.1 helix-turn-helix domain-containing protein [Chloroflexota bacterium]
MERFGEKLRQLRQYHHVTLVWLANQLGYSTHSYISEVEAGQKIPTVHFVLKVARLFQVTTDELMKDEMEIKLSDSTIVDAL